MLEELKEAFRVEIIQIGKGTFQRVEANFRDRLKEVSS